MRCPMVKRTYIPINEASGPYAEPRLHEILSDSIVAAVMRADGVDATELNAMLRRIARELHARQFAAFEPFEPIAERLAPCA
jgi:hypothetical protein